MMRGIQAMDTTTGKEHAAFYHILGVAPRTDSTHILAAIRTLNRLELVGKPGATR
jgi:hypothetical protein